MDGIDPLEPPVVAAKTLFQCSAPVSGAVGKGGAPQKLGAPMAPDTERVASRRGPNSRWRRRPIAANEEGQRHRKRSAVKQNRLITIHDMMPLCRRRIRHRHLSLESESSAQQYASCAVSPRPAIESKSTPRAHEPGAIRHRQVGFSFQSSSPLDWKEKRKKPTLDPDEFMLPGEEGEVPCSLRCTVVGTEMGVPGNDPSQWRGLSISWEFQTMIFPVVLWLLGRLHPSPRSMQHIANFIPHFKPIKSLAKVLQNL